MRARMTGVAGLSAALLACVLLTASGAGLADISQGSDGGSGLALAAAPVRPAAVAAAASSVVKRPGAVRISVLCDSVGNDIGEWVNVWARNLSADRDVEVHYFDVGGARTPRWNPQVQKFPAVTASGKGPIVFWTFGWPGGTPDTAVRNAALLFPEKPDVVLYSYGLNLAAGNVVPQFTRLQGVVRARFPAVPVVGVLAHMTPVERPGQAAGRVELAAWALRNSIPVVDQRTVFDGYRNRANEVFMDAVHPNGAGHVLLAQRLEAAFAQPASMLSAPRTGTVWVGPRTVSGRTVRFPTAVLNAAGRPVPYAVATVKGPGFTVTAEAPQTGIAWVSLPALRKRTVVHTVVSSGAVTGAYKFAVEAPR